MPPLVNRQTQLRQPLVGSPVQPAARWFLGRRVPLEEQVPPPNVTKLGAPRVRAGAAGNSCSASLSEAVWDRVRDEAEHSSAPHHGYMRRRRGEDYLTSAEGHTESKLKDKAIDDIHGGFLRLNARRIHQQTPQIDYLPRNQTDLAAGDRLALARR